MKNVYFLMTARKVLVVIAMLFCVLSLNAQLVIVPAANTNTGSVNDPLGTYYGYERTALIYTAAQIGTTGTITSVGFYVNSVATPGPAVNVRIYMKMRTTLMTANTTYATETTGATLVYGPTTIPAASFVAGNWITIPLTTNFVYTGGANNLEVIVETNATGTGNEGSTGKQFRYSNPGNNQHYQYWNQDNTAPTGNGTRSTSRPNIRLGFQSQYQSLFVSMNTGSPNWCAGETRNVTVTITNNGSLPWTDAPGVDFNVGVKWNSDPDYLVRVDALNLVPGATATYTLTVTAPMTVGSENLTFDVVREGCFWFANNSTACGYTAGPGNVVFTSVVQNIKQLPVVNAGIDDTICPTEVAALNGSATANPIVTSGSATFNYSGSGYDDDYFLIGGTTSGMPAGATITGITFNATIGAWCGSWYEFDFLVNSTYIGSGCDGTGFTYAGLNGQPANGQLLQLRSWDLDAWADNVTMTFDFTVNYTYTAPVLIAYAWSPAPSVSNPVIPNPTTSPSTTTNYTLTATADGCSASDQMTVVVESCSGLPVELSAFSASCAGGAIISWSTESQQNCDYFLVETSRDGEDWGMVTQVPGAGNSQDHIDYSIVDENAITGISYYRLKQVDHNSSTKIYGPILLNCESSDGIILYPNPAHSSFVVQIQASHPDIMAFSMRDATGKLILEKNLTVKNGTNQFPIEDLSCGSGVYFVSIVKDDGTSEIMRIVIE